MVSVARVNRVDLDTEGFQGPGGYDKGMQTAKCDVTGCGGGWGEN